MTVVKKDESKSESSEQIVNPSEVSAKNGGKIDSDKLVDESLIDPVQRIDESMIDRIQKLTSREAHDFLRRCIFSDHRDFDEILDAYERGGETFYVYTGKELSSEALRLEELVRLIFSKYLQDAFNVPVVIQLTDDDELRKKFTVEKRQRLARENAKDMIACGFDITKTFIFYVRDYFGGAYYQNMVKFMNCVPLKEAEQVLGLKSEDHVPNHSLEGAGAPADGQKPTDGYYIGKLSVLPVQAVPSFPSTFPHLFPGNDNLRCLIPCAIDQDSCFRKARDVAPQLGYSKPALVESSVFPPLQEKNGKEPNSAIYVTDAPEVIKKKINSAISGGRQFKEDQEKLGADLEIDVPFKYLNFFLEDDSELEHIKKEYGPGEMQIGAQKMQTGAVKKRAAEVLMEMVERYCRARAAVTEEMVDAFMAVRPLLTMFGSDFKSSRHKFAVASPQPTDHQKLHRSFSPGRKVEDKKDEEEAEASEQVVNPWEVSAKNGRKIDYDKLIKEFGCQRLDESIIDRVQRLTSRQPHVFLRRGVFFAHRDFNEILDSHERGEKFYLYTGRGPSSEALHLGHLIPFMFTKYLQEAFKVPLVIQLTDDEKCMWKNITVEESQRLARENAKDIIACGFDITKTFIFSDFDYVGGAFYDNMMKVADCVTINKIMGIFGFTGEDHMGKVCFPPVQAVPSFPSSFPHMFPGNGKLRCLIPCAIDQDPYFRMTRDVAERLGSSKPALIEASFLPALQGDNGKMSASDPNSAIYVTDTADDIKNKINRVFSGAKDDEELKRIVGAFLEYLHFFLEDDGELERIKKEYGAGIMLAEAVKDRLIEVLTEIVERHRRARAAVTDEMVDAFMALRLLLLSMFK